MSNVIQFRPYYLRKIAKKYIDILRTKGKPNAISFLKNRIDVKEAEIIRDYIREINRGN